MTVATMMRIVWWIAVAALGVTLLTSVLAVTAEAPVEGEDPYRSHILFALAAGMLVASAHFFFVFFLISARLALKASDARPENGYLRPLISGIVLAFGAIGLTGGALVVGIAVLTSSGREGAHQWVAWAAVTAQILALIAENRAAQVVSAAELASRPATAS